MRRDGRSGYRLVWYSWRTLWINGAPNEDVLRWMQTRGERPLMFVHIPHVLVAGPIDVTGLRTVSWDEPPDG